MDEKVRSSWSLKAVQAGLAPQASAPVAVSALAVLPVLPTAFSTASVEPRRKAGGETSEASSAPAEPSFAERPLESGPVVKPLAGAPALASDSQTLAQTPVRSSDLAARTQADEEAPSCRSGEPAALDPGQILASPEAEDDRAGADRQRGPEKSLPHCMIEFDPDADDGDVVAHAPTPQTVQVAAKSASAPPVARSTADKSPPAADAAVSPPADVAAATTNQAQPSTPAASPASDTPLVVTEATRGVGTAVIDPLVPIDSIVFGGDPLPGLDSAPAILATPPAPDAVADALAQASQAPEPWFPLNPGLDPFA
jgi:hypothetical protein